MSDSAPTLTSQAQREQKRHQVHQYLSLPVTLAAILFALVAFVQISDTSGVPWHRRFWHGPPAILLWLIWMFFIIEFLAKLTLAPRKPVYLRRHWFDALVALIPIAGILRVIESAILAPLIRLLLGKGEHPQLTILAKRKLDQLAIISALIILIAAVLAYMFENGARGSPIQSFGDALWWAAATATTVGNQLYPVTVPGEILAFCLMLFALVVFSYLTSSIASAVIGGDAASAQADQDSAQSAAQADEGQAGGATQLAQQATQSDQAAQAAQQGAQAARQDGHAGQGSIQITLSADELATLRAILARAGGQTS